MRYKSTNQIVESVIRRRATKRLTMEDLRGIVAECVEIHMMNEGWKGSDWEYAWHGMTKNPKKLNVWYKKRYEELMNELQQSGFTMDQLYNRNTKGLTEEQWDKLEELQKKFTKFKQWAAQCQLNLTRITGGEDNSSEYRGKLDKLIERCVDDLNSQGLRVDDEEVEKMLEWDSGKVQNIGVDQGLANGTRQNMVDIVVKFRKDVKKFKARLEQQGVPFEQVSRVQLSNDI